MSLYGRDWRILVCEGCGQPMGDNTMGGLHMRCEANPEPENRKTAPAYRRVHVVPLTPEECEAVVIRIEGSQSHRRLPNYKTLLASARTKLAAEDHDAEELSV